MFGFPAQLQSHLPRSLPLLCLRWYCMVCTIYYLGNRSFPSAVSMTLIWNELTSFKDRLTLATTTMPFISTLALYGNNTYSTSCAYVLQHESRLIMKHVDRCILKCSYYMQASVCVCVSKCVYHLLIHNIIEHKKQTVPGSVQWLTLSYS